MLLVPIQLGRCDVGRFGNAAMYDGSHYQPNQVPWSTAPPCTMHNTAWHRGWEVKWNCGRVTSAGKNLTKTNSLPSFRTMNSIRRQLERGVLVICAWGCVRSSKQVAQLWSPTLKCIALAVLALVIFPRNRRLATIWWNARAWSAGRTIRKEWPFRTCGDTGKEMETIIWLHIWVLMCCLKRMSEGYIARTLIHASARGPGLSWLLSCLLTVPLSAWSWADEHWA